MEGCLLKKKITILSILFCLILFTACSAKEEQPTIRDITRAGAVSYDDELITVGFVQTGKESDWRDANTNDFLNTFTVENGYNLIYIDGNSDTRRQLKAVYDLIAQNVDYIIIDPIVESDWDEVLLTAKEKEIPVIISDRMVSADPSLYTCWVGSDFHEEGLQAARWLEQYLESSNRSDEAIKIVILEGTEGATASIGRQKGLMEEISRHPNWEIVAQECGNFTQGEGTTVMEKILTETTDFDVIISHNDNMMFGAMKAMDQAGISYGAGTDVITISFDALHEAFEKMMTGELMVSVECNPLIAGLSERVIRELESGRKVDPIQYTEEAVFTYLNAANYVNERKY